MKLKDIASPRLTHKLHRTICSPKNDILSANTLMWPEIEELQRADASGLVDSCIHLQDDERELSEIILNKLTDSSYLPSPIIYQVIRAINARILISLDMRS